MAACQTYSAATQEMRVALYQSRNDDALKKLDESSVAKSKSDRVLYLMERGNILYLQGKYTEAAKAWDDASRIIEDLYTVSVSKQASSFLVNETVTDYEGEAHEKVLLPVFSALAFLAAENPNAAIVEARRTAKVLENLVRASDGKALYQRDSFAHYLAGVVFEMKREWDNAIIEYRRSIEAMQQNKSWATEVQVESVAFALARLAEKRGRRDVLEKLAKDLPGFRYAPREGENNSAEVVVFYEAGKVPIKQTEDLFVNAGSQIIRVSFPKFVDEYYASRRATVFVNGVEKARTLVAQDVGALAKQALSDRKPKYIAKIIARNLAKAVIAEETRKRAGPIAGLAVSLIGAAVEVADTRAWNTLPDVLAVARVAVPTGQKVVVKVLPDFGGAREFTYESLSPGELKVVRLRTFQ
jgi:hypothetical protein